MQDHNLEHSEGKVAKAIENQTAKLPSDLFFMGSFGFYLGLTYLKNNEAKA